MAKRTYKRRDSGLILPDDGIVAAREPLPWYAEKTLDSRRWMSRRRCCSGCSCSNCSSTAPSEISVTLSGIQEYGCSGGGCAGLNDTWILSCKGYWLLGGTASECFESWSFSDFCMWSYQLPWSLCSGSGFSYLIFLVAHTATDFIAAFGMSTKLPGNPAISGNLGCYSLQFKNIITDPTLDCSFNNYSMSPTNTYWCSCATASCYINAL